MDPDPWQEALLRSADARALMLCSRQSGKSTIAATMALHAALYEPPALALLLSPSLRQSQELFRKVRDVYRAVGGDAACPLEAESALRLELQNGSRVISLPGESDATIRGYSAVTLLVIDEAARVSDELYHAVLPMLIVSGGRLVALSTPYGRQGWFYEEWIQGEGWTRTRIEASECPRLHPQELAQQEAHLGALAYREEYLCEFVQTRDQFFSDDAISAVFRPRKL
jgi:terminase large subunit-like protein